VERERETIEGKKKEQARRQCIIRTSMTHSTFPAPPPLKTLISQTATQRSTNSSTFSFRVPARGKVVDTLKMAW